MKGAAIATPERSLLLVVDAQERLFPHIHEAPELAGSMAALARGAGLLGVPAMATEQYVKGLGKTIPDVAAALPEGAPVVEKVAFSCWNEPAAREKLRGTHRDTIFLAGIEAHICVMQTALDLLREGYKVHVVEDAVGSRTPGNKAAGLRRMERAGAVGSTVEMALFEWMGGKDHPQFKGVQSLIK